MNVPFLDVGATYRELKSEIDAAVARVLERGWFVLGPEVEAFQAEYARYVGAAYCVGVGNGLDALHLALRALGVGAGDEVIVPSNTYIATWLAVNLAGARPVPVEPDAATYTIDPTRIVEAITPATKAIMPVHLYGTPCDMEAMARIATDHGLVVVDDAAQAHGAAWDGRRIGGWADATAWSFYPSKNLGAFGDGGAVTTDRADVAARVAELGNYGSAEKYVNAKRGVNSRLDELQAAVLRVKLPLLDEWNSRRAALAARYSERLADVEVVLPGCASRGHAVWHVFVVRVQARDTVVEDLRARGVQTVIHYPIAPHLQDAYRDHEWRPGDFPISERIHREVLSLPMGPHLSSSEVDYVCDVVEAALQ